MTAAADIVVKKADNATNITWSLVSASGGDKSPAVWRSATLPGYVGQQPVFQVSARANADGTVRRFDGFVRYPSVYTDTASSTTKVLSVPYFSFSFAMPQIVATTDMNEFAAQCGQLVGSTLMRQALASGFAPT